MSNAVLVLYEEHQIIKKALNNVLALKSLIENEPETYKSEMGKYIDFFRNYADKFHHHKEEILLFPEMSKKNELLEGGVIQEMLDNHSDFRIMLREIETFVDKKEYEKAHREFEKYYEALLDHIAVEDDEVFQMALSLFDQEELQKMYYKFMDVDAELGIAKKQVMEEMVS